MTTEPTNRDHFTDWRPAAGTRRDCGEIELTIPIDRDSYFTITADPDTAAMVPAVLRKLLSQPEPEVAGLGNDTIEADFRSWYNDRYHRSYFGGIALVECIEWTRYALTRYATPQPSPVPVAERLPEPEDCDGEGWCWMYEPDGVWWQVLIGAPHIMPSLTHWLPHNALPVPGAEAQP
jgi:hypothetical protein